MAIKISGSTIIDDSRNIVNAGIITASSFSGDGSGLTGVGIGTDGSVNTTGIVTGSVVSANEFIGTGDKLIFSPTVTSFSPIDGATDIAFDSEIVLTFDQPIYAGVGTINLRNSSGIGTVIEFFDISVGTGVTIVDRTLRLTPQSNLPVNTDVYVVLDQGVVKNSIGGGNAALDTYNFTTLNFALTSLDPSNGATNIGLSTNITLSFTTAPTQGTGTIELKSGSVDGPIVESFNAASSPRISVSGNDWILDPTSDLSFNTSYHLVVPSTAITGYAGLNTTGGDTHSFTTRALALGDSYEGGNLICQSGGIRWVTAPSSSEVCRTFVNIADSNTRAQQVSGCSGWFVPTCGQLQNPGAVCRTYWENIRGARYHSSSPNGSGNWVVFMGNNPYLGCAFCAAAPANYYVRSFRCVSY